MDYVAKNLKKDEKIIIYAKFSKWQVIESVFVLLLIIGVGIVVQNLFKWIFAAIPDEVMYPEILDKITGIIAKIIYVVGAIWFIIDVLSMLTSKLAVTNLRVIGKLGILSVKLTDIPINKVDSVNVEAGILGRIFGYYALSISTAGNATVGAGDAAGKGTIFPAISNANQVKNAINDALEKYADETRKAQAKEIANAMNQKVEN